MQLNVFITASWKHQHAVEMLTSLLTKEGHTVRACIEHDCRQHSNTTNPSFMAGYVNEKCKEAFQYDVNWSQHSECVVYIGQSGKDTSALVGMAYANNTPIVGLWQSGEDFGLMRNMMNKWVDKYEQVIEFVNELRPSTII